MINAVGAGYPNKKYIAAENKTSLIAAATVGGTCCALSSVAQIGNIAKIQKQKLKDLPKFIGEGNVKKGIKSIVGFISKNAFKGALWSAATMGIFIGVSEGLRRSNAKKEMSN